MPYNINRFNGVKVTTVEDGTVDNTLDIKLVGKNYAGYGEIQNENMVHMLENFASTTAPPRKITGQLWYDTLGKKLKFYDGTQFRTTGGAEVGTTQPSGLSQGDFWLNTSTNQLFTWDGDEFILVGPQAVENAGATELRSVSVIDSNDISRPVVKAFVNNIVVFIISNNAFTLRNDSTLRPNFIEIKKGITLSNSVSGISTSDWIYWGTASSALGLVDTDGTLLTASNLIKANNVNFSGLVRFNDQGFLLGDGEDIRFFIDNDIPVLLSQTNDVGLVFKSKVSNATSPKTCMKLLGNDILPGVNDVSNVGSLNQKFNTVYAITFKGSLDGSAKYAESLLADGTYKTATADADPDTIVVRDGLGRITANAFLGQTTSSLNLTGGAEDSLVYQTSPNVTGFLSRGAVGTVLTINSSNKLEWKMFNSLLPTNVAATTLIVNNETNAGNYYLTFVSGTGQQNFKIETSALTYNPGNNTITADFFDGLAARSNTAGTITNQANSATINATSANTPNTIVLRDGTGSFAAGQITATAFIGPVSGNASTATTANNIVNQANSATINATSTNTPNTIVLRDGNGNFAAGVITATATSAQYADLAEKYLADKEYDIGTVLMVGGEKEVTACQVGSRAIGAVSNSPAYVMNNDLENGTIVGLKGRIPIKVKGVVIKGQKLIAAENGTAVVSLISSSDVFAIALESSNLYDIKLIEAIIL